MFSTIPLLFLIFSRASLIIDKVFKPKKSILISPVSSITEPSYCVTSIFSPVSLSSAVLTGTQSVISSRQMIVPQACTPVLRTFPSNIFAYLIVSRRIGSEETSAACSSGTYAMAFGKFSLMASLVAIVPYVMICATFSCPYFSVTQFSTRPRPSSSKSTSISGNEIRSGFRKRSNSRSYLIGSICVIPRQ